MHLFLSYTSLVEELTNGDVSYDQLRSGLFFFGCEKSVIDENAGQPVTRSSVPPGTDSLMNNIRRANKVLEHNAHMLVAMAIEFAWSGAVCERVRCAFRKPSAPWPEVWDRLWTLLQANEVPGMNNLAAVWKERIADADCCPSAIERVLEGVVEVTIHK